MASQSNTAPLKTESKSSSINTSIRCSIAILFSLILGSFIFLWDGGIIPLSPSLPSWTGFIVFLPVIAYIGSFGTNALIQYLSCTNIQWSIQAQRSVYVVLPIWILWIILYFLPGLRWPIEGLIQNSSIPMRHGLSSAFYVFWIGMYSSGLLNGLAQICPN